MYIYNIFRSCYTSVDFDICLSCFAETLTSVDRDIWCSNLGNLDVDVTSADLVIVLSVLDRAIETSTDFDIGFSSLGLADFTSTDFDIGLSSLRCGDETSTDLDMEKSNLGEELSSVDLERGLSERGDCSTY